MRKAERYAITFVLLLNIFICAVTILVLGNASTVDDLSYIGTSDAGFLVIASILGLGANVLLGWLLIRILARILRQRPPPGRITGE
jgi:hypothetical protein